MAKRLINGDSRIELGKLDADSIHACVTDPPYHLTSIVKRFGGTNAAPCQEGTDGAYARAAKGFMGKEWDGGDIAFDPTFWAEVYRVLKPGGYLLAFGGSRTYHRMACAIEDAGFEIRDTIMYCYASGFPKSHNVALGIDKLNGGENRGHAIAVASNVQPNGQPLAPGELLPAYEGKSDISKPWGGFGTALKPAIEPIVFARKRLAESSIARNVLAHGTGAINIDACRIGTNEPGYFETDNEPTNANGITYGFKDCAALHKRGGGNDLGRWPSNLLLSCQCDGSHDADCPLAILDAQSGVSSSAPLNCTQQARGLDPMLSRANPSKGAEYGRERVNEGHSDSGGASRFYFVAKPSRREKGERNIHPTVKPVELMKYLCRLVCPPGGTILDPFAGSGTTAVACEILGLDYIAIERESDYFEIMRGRVGQAFTYVDDDDLAAKSGQPTLF